VSFGHYWVPVANALGFTARDMTLTYLWPTLGIGD
jgi:hypothetical protein